MGMSIQGGIMTLEIERKWFIDVEELPFPLERFERHRIVQSYVSFSPQIRIRSIDDERFILTVKGKAAGVESALAREEFELELSEESYRHLLSKTEGKTLVKTRYVVPEAAIDDGVIADAKTEGSFVEGPCETACARGRVFEIDVFEGDFKDGNIDGEGVAHYADGSKFKGTFKNGKRNGAAIEEDKDGNRFEGNYVDDRRDGRFVERDRNGNITAHGTYVRGRKKVD